MDLFRQWHFVYTFLIWTVAFLFYLLLLFSLSRNNLGNCGQIQKIPSGGGEKGEGEDPDNVLFFSHQRISQRAVSLEKQLELEGVRTSTSKET